jgi:hypothetical protein
MIRFFIVIVSKPHEQSAPSDYEPSAPSDFRKVEPNNFARRSLWNTCACSKFRRKPFDLKAHSSFSRAAKTPISTTMDWAPYKKYRKHFRNISCPCDWVRGRYQNLSAEWLTSLLLRSVFVLVATPRHFFKRKKGRVRKPESHWTPEATLAVEGHDALMFH